MRQHTIGYHFDIAANARDGVHERQPVESPCGVICHDDQRAVFGDLFEIAGGDGAVNIQVLQNLLHHIESFQVAVSSGELLKLFFIK